MSTNNVQSPSFKSLSKTFTRVIGSFGIAISVYIGFYLGFVIQQVDRVGQATLFVQVNNASTEVSSWLNQSVQGTNDFLPETMLYAALLVPVLLRSKPGLQSLSSALQTILFPILFVVSWLALPAATLPASIPQPLLSISQTGLSTDVNLSIAKIFTFLTFYESFALALETLTIITVFWIFTRLIGLKSHFSLNIVIIVAPIAVWFLIQSVFPVGGITLQPGPTSNLVVKPVGGGGCVGCLPSLLVRLSSCVTQLALGIWVVSVGEFLLMRYYRTNITGFTARLRKAVGEIKARLRQCLEQETLSYSTVSPE